MSTSSKSLSIVAMIIGGSLFICGCLTLLLVTVAQLNGADPQENLQGFLMVVLICPVPLLVFGFLPLLVGAIVYRKQSQDDSDGMATATKLPPPPVPPPAPVASPPPARTSVPPQTASTSGAGLWGSAAIAATAVKERSNSPASSKPTPPPVAPVQSPAKQPVAPPPPLIVPSTPPPLPGSMFAAQSSSYAERCIHAQTLHETARNHNWDTGVSELFNVIREPDCDKGTALMVYWMGRPEWDLQYVDRGSVPPWRVAEYDLLAEIQRRFAEGFYQLQNIGFDPRNDNGYDWTNQYPDLREQFVTHIPDAMYEAILARP